MILVIKHIEIEGPGTIEDYLKARGYSLKIVALHRGEHLPEDLSDIEAVIPLGGPMNVYEEDKFSFLKDENLFLKRVIRAEIPMLGICLGSQLIAKAAGAKIVKSPAREVGWYKIDLRDEASADSLFKGLGKKVDVYQWHEDMWELPPGATLLAGGAECPHQAYRIGKCAYGVQFHVEITDAIIASWCKAYFKSDDEEKQRKAREMIADYPKMEKILEASCDVIYENFVRLIEERKKQLSAK